MHGSSGCPKEDVLAQATPCLASMHARAPALLSDLDNHTSADAMLPLGKMPYIFVCPPDPDLRVVSCDLSDYVMKHRNWVWCNLLHNSAL